MKKIFVVLFMTLLATLSVKAAGDDDNVVYVWGASYSFTDSIVYFTEIQPLEGLELTKGTGLFLIL